MSIITNLSQFNPRLKRWDGDLGVEIETETKTPYEIPKFSFWETHNDGSLRDFGIEYVLRQPLSFEKDLKTALEEFKSKTEGFKFKKESVTTSVHVHLNFLNDKWVTVFNFLTAYTLVENLLIRYSGESRRSNLFCLPICDSEDIHELMMNMLTSVQKKQYGSLQLSEENSKYGAINIGSLYRLGSLEVRSYRGTTDINEIYDWCGILHSLQTYARLETLTPKIIVDDYRDRGLKILETIFGQYRSNISHLDEEMLLEKNFWYTANLGYNIKDWSVLDTEPVKKKVSKELDPLSIQMYGVVFNSLTANQQRQVMQSAQDGTTTVLYPTTAEPGVITERAAMQALIDTATTNNTALRNVRLPEWGEPVTIAGTARAPTPVRITDWCIYDRDGRALRAYRLRALAERERNPINGEFIDEIRATSVGSPGFPDYFYDLLEVEQEVLGGVNF